MSSDADYLRATRHPWSCSLFLLPLLLAYEAGVFYLGGPNPAALRNGADNWLRQGLSVLGLRDHFWAPALFLGVLTLWNLLCREERPADIVGVLTGMVIESVGFALGLWGVSRGLGALVDSFGLPLAAGGRFAATEQIVTYLGAGLFEELLFRLLLFSGLLLLTRWAGVPRFLSFAFAATASAVFFSVAHHLGRYGEPFDAYVFLFRFVAGLYFAAVYRWRGFGIAVGAHACYNVLVGGVTGAVGAG